jgi:integrase
MGFQVGHVPAHKGKTTTTDPLKTPEAVQKVKDLLAGNVRDYALWVVAVNSALRSGDLCRLKWEDTVDDGICIQLRVLEGKTKKPRTIPLNPDTSAALRAWRFLCESEFVYSGQRGALTTATWGRSIKAWCESVGFTGNFSGHSARKTFVRVQHDHFGTSLPVLMKVLNHSTELQTMTYMGRLGDDVLKAYGNGI